MHESSTSHTKANANANLKLFDAQQSQAIDQFAIQQCKIPSFLLMKRAAWFAWQTIQALPFESSEIWILCGPGNNGGDGFMLAQYAKLAGKNVRVWTLTETSNLQNDAKKAHEELSELKVAISNLNANQFLSELQNAATSQINSHKDAEYLPAGKQSTKHLIVDALFGTGLSRPIEGELTELFQHLNRADSKLFKIALDTPSGLNVATGEIQGTALKADMTISFLTHKFGFYTAEGSNVCGEIYYSDLNLSLDAPQALNSQTPVAISHAMEYWVHKKPKLLKNAHKGSNGTTLLIGGNHSMSGAVQLAATAAVKTGCGLTKVITRKSNHAGLSSAHPEIMCYRHKDWKSLFASSSAIGIGPGFGQDKWAQTLWQALLSTLNRPVSVVDADALNLLAKAVKYSDSNFSENLKSSQWILTPHPAEAARLLGSTIQDIQNDRLSAIKALHQKFGGVIVLKGNGTLIYDGQQVELCRYGNPGMAKGGMGDVLTGTITSLLAQGMELFEAACLGVNLHATAADKIANVQGLAAVTPSQIPEHYSALLEQSKTVDIEMSV